MSEKQQEILHYVHQTKNEKYFLTLKYDNLYFYLLFIAC